MAKYTGPRLKLSRREGCDLNNISGIRPIGTKCKAEVPPGQHGSKKGRISDYAIQFRAKQKLRRIYNVLEKQFRNYFKLAAKRKGSTGENLVQILEGRLDNVVYRMGFGVTRAEARQLVNHKGILVNKKVVNIPSYQVAAGDIVEIREKCRGQIRVKAALDLLQQKEPIEWIDVDATKMLGVYKYTPTLGDLPPDYNINLIVELYSK